MTPSKTDLHPLPPSPPPPPPLSIFMFDNPDTIFVISDFHKVKTEFAVDRNNKRCSIEYTTINGFDRRTKNQLDKYSAAFDLVLKLLRTTNEESSRSVCIGLDLHYFNGSLHTRERFNKIKNLKLRWLRNKKIAKKFDMNLPMGLKGLRITVENTFFTVSHGILPGEMKHVSLTVATGRKHCTLLFPSRVSQKVLMPDDV